MSNPLPQRIQQLYIKRNMNKSCNNNNKKEELQLYISHCADALPSRWRALKQSMLSDLTFAAFTAYQSFSSLAVDYLGRTKRFHDELVLFTQPRTLSVLKSKATNTLQWFLTRTWILNQITVIEIPASLRLLQVGGFHLFYLVNRFETKNAGYKQKNFHCSPYSETWWNWECHSCEGLLSPPICSVQPLARSLWSEDWATLWKHLNHAGMGNCQIEWSFSSVTVRQGYLHCAVASQQELLFK